MVVVVVVMVVVLTLISLIYLQLHTKSSCEIECSNSSVDEDSNLLGYNAGLLVEYFLMFSRILVPSHVG